MFQDFWLGRSLAQNIMFIFENEIDFEIYYCIVVRLREEFGWCGVDVSTNIYI